MRFGRHQSHEGGVGLKKNQQRGQALTEMMATLGLIIMLVSAIKVFARIASADDAQIAEARWLSFHCAYRSTYCDSLPETHGSDRSELDMSMDRGLERSMFDAGASLLDRYMPRATATRSPEEFASSFGINVNDDLYVAEVSTTIRAGQDERRVGLPAQLTLAPRRLALLSGDGSLQPNINGEAVTIERAKRSVAVPGQTALDALLSLNESVRGLLASLGLETIETKWSEREVKALDRVPLGSNSSSSDCSSCPTSP